jgi:hypothetical protein
MIDFFLHSLFPNLLLHFFVILTTVLTLLFFYYFLYNDFFTLAFFLFLFLNRKLRQRFKFSIAPELLLSNSFLRFNIFLIGGYGILVLLCDPLLICLVYSCLLSIISGNRDATHAFTEAFFKHCYHAVILLRGLDPEVGLHTYTVHQEVKEQFKVHAIPLFLSLYCLLDNESL